MSRFFLRKVAEMGDCSHKYYQVFSPFSIKCLMASSTRRDATRAWLARRLLPSVPTASILTGKCRGEQQNSHPNPKVTTSTTPQSYFEFLINMDRQQRDENTTDILFLLLSSPIHLFPWKQCMQAHNQKLPNPNQPPDTGHSFGLKSNNNGKSPPRPLVFGTAMNLVCDLHTGLPRSDACIKRWPRGRRKFLFCQWLH